MNEILDRLRTLERDVARLQAEADIRRIQARYMFLCDTPCPEPGLRDDDERIDRIMALYAEDAIWEGVGDHYAGQFGRAEGKAAIRAHFERFWSATREPALVLNVHYLTSEQIHVEGDSADGQWVHCQPWLFADNTALLRSSRLNNRFRRQDDGWKITRTRTENVLVAKIPTGAITDHAKRSVLMDS